jgi:soluble lytic murein transglycosylase-like protein
MKERTYIIAGGLALAGLLLMPRKAFSEIAAAISANYDTLIITMAGKYGLPVRRVAAMVMQESSGNPSSVGLAGEHGLMQMMPGALADVNASYGFSFSFDDLFQPEIAIETGCAYLSWLSHQFGGDIDLATQAYNAGIGNVRKNSSAGTAYLQKVKSKELLFASL